MSSTSQRDGRFQSNIKFEGNGNVQSWSGDPRVHGKNRKMGTYRAINMPKCELHNTQERSLVKLAVHITVGALEGRCTKCQATSTGMNITQLLNECCKGAHEVSHDMKIIHFLNESL